MVDDTSESTLRAAVVGIVAGCFWLLFAPVAVTQNQPKPKLEELWEEYPLRPPQTSPEPQPNAPEQNPAPLPPTPTTASDDTNWTPLAIAAAAALLVLLGSLATLAATRRRSERTPAQLPPPLLANLTPDQLIEHAFALANEARECDMLLGGQRDEGTRGMTEAVNRDLSSAPEKPREASPYADIGERVASVLAAAETAATQILEDARSSAEQTLDAARREADDVRQKAAAYDADTREAVDSFAATRRREAEQEIQKQLADSEAQARATRQAAEAMARQIEEDGTRRGQELRDESKAVEERLKKALAGLRRMTAEIEQLLGPPAEEGESLADALRPYGKRAADGQPGQPAVASRTTEEI
jgi:hypothetical protein